MKPQESVGKKVVAGTAWMVAARWCMRGIGLVSTIILARLLTPDDFGVVAVAMIVVGLIEVFGETGLDQSLIRHPNPSREHFDTVWTLQILLGLLIAAGLVVVAPLGAEYFDDERITIVIQVLALRAFLQGFENTGTIWFRKNMEFNKEFKLLVWRKSIRFFVVVILAFVLGDYWALVYAMVSAKVIHVILSYLMHPFRPRFSLSKVGEIWSFSTWMLVVHIGQFINSRIDEIVIGGTINTTSVGIYSVAGDIARSPTEELVLPISRVLFSAYSKLTHATEDIAAPFLKSFGAVATICFATGGGIALVSEDLVLVVLGQKWLPAIGPMSWIALSAIVFGLTTSMAQLLTVLGNVKIASFLSWAQVSVLLPVLYFTAQTGDLSIVGAGRFTVLLGLLFPTIFIFSRVTKITLLSIMACLWKPMLAFAAMGLVLLYVGVLVTNPSLYRLLLMVGLGAVAYSGSIYLLWRVTGRPDGFEAKVLKNIHSRYLKVTKRLTTGD